MFKQEGEEVWLKLKKYVEQSIVKKRIVWIEKKDERRRLVGQGMYRIKGQRKESVLKVETGNIIQTFLAASNI